MSLQDILFAPEVPRAALAQDPDLARVDLPVPETLDELASSALVVTVWSEVLGANVLFAGDAAQVEGAYTAAELRVLLELQPSAEALRRLDEVKQAFGGRITGVVS